MRTTLLVALACVFLHWLATPCWAFNPNGGCPQPSSYGGGYYGGYPQPAPQGFSTYHRDAMTGQLFRLRYEPVQWSAPPFQGTPPGYPGVVPYGATANGGGCYSGGASAYSGQFTAPAYYPQNGGTTIFQNGGRARVIERQVPIFPRGDGD